MTIDWWTLALQTINVLILVWLLQRFLYRPVLAAVDRRRAAVKQALDDAEAARKSAEEDRDRLAAARSDIQRERDEALSKARATAEQEHRRIAEAAHAEADRIVAEANTAIARERETAEHQMIGKAADLAVAMARRLLAEGGSLPGPELFMDRALATLEAMPAGERERLAAALDERPVRLVSAQPLAPADVEACRTRLAAALGHDIRLEASTDAGLIAGLDIHLPHAVLGFSWRQALDDARKELAGDDDARPNARSLGA